MQGALSSADPHTDTLAMTKNAMFPIDNTMVIFISYKSIMQ